MNLFYLMLNTSNKPHLLHKQVLQDRRNSHGDTNETLRLKENCTFCKIVETELICTIHYV